MVAYLSDWSRSRLRRFRIDITFIDFIKFETFSSKSPFGGFSTPSSNSIDSQVEP